MKRFIATGMTALALTFGAAGVANAAGAPNPIVALIKALLSSGSTSSVKTVAPGNQTTYESSLKYTRRR